MLEPPLFLLVVFFFYFFWSLKNLYLAIFHLQHKAKSAYERYRYNSRKGLAGSCSRCTAFFFSNNGKQHLTMRESNHS
jgi:hypothetical protein